MTDAKSIEEWLEDYLAATDMVLIDIGAGGAFVEVLLDSPEGIKISDCASVNRALRRHLGDAAEQLDIRVSSPGLDKPLTRSIQYVRHTGNRVRVQLNDGNICSGLLGATSSDKIRIRTQKKRGKEIILTDETKDIGFNDIASTKIII